MPYTLPTVEEFKTRFPIFAEAPEPLIGMLLLEAANTIDTSWVETDYQPAILYLAAHLYALDNSGEGEDVDIGGGGGAIVSESFSGMSISYGQGGSAAGGASVPDQWNGTVYGRRYWYILRRNRGGPVVV